MRDKEVRQDYRYMAEPNLPQLLLDDFDANDSSSSVQRGAHQRVNIGAQRVRLPAIYPYEVVQQWIEYGLPHSHVFTILVRLGSDHENHAFCRITHRCAHCTRIY
jgi:hypothetical protein